MSAIDDVTRVAYDAGFRGEALVTAVSIAMAESGGSSTAYNPETAAGAAPGMGSYGLWQVFKGVWGALASFDPQANANAAYQISQGGTKWTDWSTYTSGAYRQFLGAASDAVDRFLGVLNKPTSSTTTSTLPPGVPVTPMTSNVSAPALAPPGVSDAAIRSWASGIGQSFEQGKAFVNAVGRLPTSLPEYVSFRDKGIVPQSGILTTPVPGQYPSVAASIEQPNPNAVLVGPLQDIANTLKTIAEAPAKLVQPFIDAFNSVRATWKMLGDWEKYTGQPLLKSALWVLLGILSILVGLLLYSQSFDKVRHAEEVAAKTAIQVGELGAELA